MKKKFRIIIAAMLCICLTIGVTGCAALEDTINEIQGILPVMVTLSVHMITTEIK